MKAGTFSCYPKMNDMQKKDYNQEPEKQNTSVERTPEEIKQEQSDPNITELKGFIDPDEKLEPEGTDNDV